MDYEKEFNIFSSNINQAARAFYYHQEIQRQVYDDGVKHQSLPDGYFQDSKMFQAMQANSQFWMDYKHSSIVFAIITLGRILDKNSNAHKIERLIKAARNSGLFNNDKLRERKIKGSDNADEWIDNYMNNAHELSSNNFAEILSFAEETRKKWETVKDLRNKIYAHQEALDDVKKAAIFKKSTYGAFEEIIERLLILEHIFLEAFHNGKLPDFDYKNQRIKNAVVEDVKSLLQRLSK